MTTKYQGKTLEFRDSLRVGSCFDKDGELPIEIAYEWAFMRFDDVVRLRDHLNSVLAEEKP